MFCVYENGAVSEETAPAWLRVGLYSLLFQIGPIVAVRDKVLIYGPLAGLVLSHALSGHLSCIIAGVKRGRPYA
jgi:hypothetical protein